MEYSIHLLVRLESVQKQVLGFGLPHQRAGLIYGGSNCSLPQLIYTLWANKRSDPFSVALRLAEGWLDCIKNPLHISGQIFENQATVPMKLKCLLLLLGKCTILYWLVSSKAFRDLQSRKLRE